MLPEQRLSKNKRILFREQDLLSEAYMILMHEEAVADGRASLPHYNETGRYSRHEALDALVWLLRTPDQFEALLPVLRKKSKQLQAENPAGYLDITVR